MAPASNGRGAPDSSPCDAREDWSNVTAVQDASAKAAKGLMQKEQRLARELRLDGTSLLKRVGARFPFGELLVRVFVY